MGKTIFRNMLAGSVALGALTVAASQAMAGGFINQSQSTVYNGSAYAGYAAPGSSPSAMFLNPATMTEFTRITTENNFSLVMPNTRINGTFLGPIPNAAVGSGDQGQDSLVPASYVVIPWGDWRFGASLNAPYGSVTSPDRDWGGRVNSLSTKARTITITPAIAYQISPQLSIGVGLQIQYFKARFIAAGAAPLPTPVIAGLEGDGWGFGVTAGLTWKPFAGTSIGIGYRSRIDQPFDGSYILATAAGAPAGALHGSPISGTLRLPDRLNLSIRQTITPQLDLLASVEWQGWGRIGTARLNGPLVGAAPLALQRLPFNFRDGWYFALGAEYRYNEALTLRAGMAYEIAPVTDAVRGTRLPDNDRFWLSAGLSYAVTDRVTVNASYSHVFVKNANIDISPTNPANGWFTATNPYRGTARQHTDIVSLGITTKWGEAPQGALRTVQRKY